MTYRIAAGTIDGLIVTEHFGQCARADVYEVSQESDEMRFIETRVFETGAGCGGGHDEDRVAAKARALSDCQILLMARVGPQSEKQLTHWGFIVLSYEGLLEQALTRIKGAYRKRVFQAIGV